MAPRRVTNSELAEKLDRLTERLAAMEATVEPISRAWRDGRAGLKGASWTLTGVFFVLSLWWTGILQKAWQFLTNHTPPGAA